LPRWCGGNLRRRHPALAAERFGSALRAGFRHARNNPHLQCNVIRGRAFFLFASAYWRCFHWWHAPDRRRTRPLWLSARRNRSRRRGRRFCTALVESKAWTDRLGPAGSLGTALAMVLFGTCARSCHGSAGKASSPECPGLPSYRGLNVSAQVALPEWCAAVGSQGSSRSSSGPSPCSAIWGQVAGLAGLPLAHFLGRGRRLAAVPLTWRWKLQTGAEIDLTPSMHWPAPVVSHDVEQDRGPVLVTVEYRIDPRNREPFLAAAGKARSSAPT